MTKRPTADGLQQRWALIFCTCIIVSVSGIAVTGVIARHGRHHAFPPTQWAAETSPVHARAMLGGLPMVEESPEVAYDRTSDFGPAWSDVDHNGCDTRNDILHRDLTDLRFRPATHDCVVVSGRLVDPYTGEPMAFAKSHAADVQIDHLIPLHAAWILGAWRWSAARRLAFANDPRELVAASGPANQAKSDSLVDRWRPSDHAVWCVYAINTVVVHDAYALGVTRAERRALVSMLSMCR